MGDRVEEKFSQVSQCAAQVGLSDLARYSQDGTKNYDPNFPFKLFLVPGPEVQMDEEKKTIDEVHYAMAAWEVGTKIFTVWACESVLGDEMTPTQNVEASCGYPVLLGEMVTTSQCTTSAYGDAKLFFRHQRIEEDWAVKEEFFTRYNA